MKLDRDSELVGVATGILEELRLAGIDLARREHCAQTVVIPPVPGVAKRDAVLEPLLRLRPVRPVEDVARTVVAVIAAPITRPGLVPQT